jgi:hypothetical protein
MIKATYNGNSNRATFADRRKWPSPATYRWQETRSKNLGISRVGVDDTGFGVEPDRLTFDFKKACSSVLRPCGDDDRASSHSFIVVELIGGFTE